MQKSKLIILILGIGIMASCLALSRNWKEEMPASWGKYSIDSIANEVLLQKEFPDAKHSPCGLAYDAFEEYARSQVNRKRQFQFMVFIDGKPAVGGRCWRKAFIFYLKEDG